MERSVKSTYVVKVSINYYVKLHVTSEHFVILAQCEYIGRQTYLDDMALLHATN